MPLEILKTPFSSLPIGKASDKKTHVASAFLQRRIGKVSSHRNIRARIEFATFAYLLAVGFAILWAAPRAGAQTVYVAGSGFLQAIDTETNTVLFQTLGPCSPGSNCFSYIEGLAISPDGKYLYMGGFATDGTGALLAFDTQNQTYSTVVGLGNAWPAGPIQISPDGNTIYLETTPTTFPSSATGVAVIDLSTNTLARSITLPFVAWGNNLDPPRSSISFTPNSQYIYEINPAQPSQVAVISTATGGVIGVFSLNYIYTDSKGIQHPSSWAASRIAFTVDGSKAYIEGAGGDTSSLAVLDATSNKVIATVPRGPLGITDGPIVCGSNGSCYVIAFTGGGVSTINTATDTFSGTVNYVGSEATAAALTPDWRFLYITNWQRYIGEVDTTFNQVADYSVGTLQYLTGIAISPFGPGPLNGKALGDSGCECPSSVGLAAAGEPISVENGNMYEHVTDYKTAGPNPLEFTRYYNSLGSANGIFTYASELGKNWRSTYDRYLRIGSTTVTAERADGQNFTFTSNKGAWTSDSDVDTTLRQSGSTWTLIDHHDTVETYTALPSGEGLLQSIKARNGYSQNLAYNTSNQLVFVTDSFNRSLNLVYNASGLLKSVTTPESLVLSYTETAPSTGYQLTSVSYNTSPATSQTYLYENSTFPFALTGITDEDGNRYATWTYGKDGRATSSQLGAGANLTSVAYNSDGSTTVTNALGVADTYTFTQLQGVPKVTQISRAATSTTAAATSAFTYDTNGYMSSRTDWNGNQTAYVNDAHGDPTTISEAVGTAAARTTTIAYDATWIHLPSASRPPASRRLIPTTATAKC